MATLRLFASAREAAGVAKVQIEAATVEELMAEARSRFGARFVAVADSSRVWVNGGPAEPSTHLTEHDVVAVLPPVSGGARPAETGIREASSFDALDTAAPGVARPGFAGPGGAAGIAAPGFNAPGIPGESRGGAAALLETAGPDPSPRRHLRLVTVDAPTAAGFGGEDGYEAGLGFNQPINHDALARTLAPAPAARPSPKPSVDVDPAAEALPSPHRDQGGRDQPRARKPLAIIPTSDRPHGRLGLAWAAVTSLVLLAGPLPLALWLGVGAGVAAVQAVRAWVARREKVLPLWIILAAVGLPVAAAWGLTPVWITALVVVAGMLGTRALLPSRDPVREVGVSLALGFGIGLAAAAPVYLRGENLAAPLFLLACVAAYDTGAYLVGTGAKSAWEGPVGGVAALIPLTIMASVVLEPPLAGAVPLLLGLMAAVLAPLGPLAASALLGDRDASAPALRRLDSLLLLGPAWWLVAAALL